MVWATKTVLLTASENEFVYVMSMMVVAVNNVRCAELGSDWIFYGIFIPFIHGTPLTDYAVQR